MRGSDTGMGGQSLFTEIIKNWWESFPPRSRSRGNIAGGLVILENLRDNFDLNIEAHKATGQRSAKKRHPPKCP